MKITFIANIKGIYFGYSFGPSSVVTIGREIGNTIAPINVEGFSRRHARIFFRDGGWYIEDLGSTNGTYRNRVKIESATKLEKGDSIRCGLLELASFNFEAEDAAAPASAPATAPAAAPAAAKPAPAAAAPAAAKPAQPQSLPQMLAARKTEMSIKPPVMPAAAKTEVEMLPVEPVADLPDAAAAKPAVKKPASPLSPAAPGGIRRPTVPGAKPILKPGLKLPPKPEMQSGLKLPPKAEIRPGLKLPSKTAPAAPAQPGATNA